MILADSFCAASGHTVTSRGPPGLSSKGVAQRATHNPVPAVDAYLGLSGFYSEWQIHALISVITPW